MTNWNRDAWAVYLAAREERRYRAWLDAMREYALAYREQTR